VQWQQHWEPGPTKKFIVWFSLEVKYLSPIRIHHQSKEMRGEVYGECVRSENGAENSKMVKWVSQMFALVCPRAVRTDVSAIKVEEIILQSESDSAFCVVNFQDSKTNHYIHQMQLAFSSGMNPAICTYFGF
jgi:hypothetical protein